MDMRITGAIAKARGLAPGDARIVGDLVAEWQDHYQRNRLRDAYYYGHVKVKDLGVSVSPTLMRKIDPHVDWAAKCVDWWGDRVQFDGVTADDARAGELLEQVFYENDAKNLMRKAVSVALRHSCSFLTVTEDADTHDTVVSAYPATAASALWDEARKRIRAGLVVVESDKPRGSSTRYPKAVNVFTEGALIELRRDGGGPWRAGYVRNGLGRVPMEPVVYHPTLERPFGRSRITRTVMALVDDAQREMANMTAAAAFAAAPQKYLLNTDKETARALAESPFAAYIGSLLVATQGRNGQSPQFGQLAQLSMQPHMDYMRSLAAQFSGATGVPLSSLGVVTDNPSSAEAIYAGKEDAVVDIQAFVDGCKRSLANVALMVLANEEGATFKEVRDRHITVDVHFRKPDRPSVVSQSDAMVKQIGALPWLADSDIALREFGYDDEQVHQLRSDRRRSQAQGTFNAVAQAMGGQAGSQQGGEGGQ